MSKGEFAAKLTKSFRKMLPVRVGSQNRLFYLSKDGKMKYMTADDLRAIVPGFKPGKPAVLGVNYREKDRISYHLHNGGKHWIPTVPSEIAKPGELLTISADVLTVAEFVNALPGVAFFNDTNINWIAESSQMVRCELLGNHIAMRFVQESPQGASTEFAIAGSVSNSVGVASASGPYLDTQINDMFGQTRNLRIYFDGTNYPSMGIQVGKKFGAVHMISFDGVRLAIAYEMGIDRFQVATLYEASPATLYLIAEDREYSFPYEVEGCDRSLRIGKLDTLRALERSIIHGGSKNDAGRIGSEIAYKVAIETLGLDDVIIQDPSAGGSDLYTRDGGVLMEARLLRRTENEQGVALLDDIAKQLNQMIRKLRRDLAGRSAILGYAVLSFVGDRGEIQILTLAVPSSRHTAVPK